MKLKSLAYALLGCGSLAALPQVAQAQFADVVFVVDESGSMSGEHAWIGSMVSALDAALNTAGVTNNQFALVGFGGHSTNSGHLHTNLTTSAALSAATGGLVASGGLEDGYAGIQYALNNVSFRAGSKRNVILITDEDRDVEIAGYTFANTKTLLQQLGALLNVVVNAPLTGGGIGGDGALKYIADGVGGYTTAAYAGVTGAFGTTQTDYIDLAFQTGTGGATWDLNVLRNGGQGAVSFTKAFIDVKVGEIIKQDPGGAVPEPSTYGMIGAATLLALVVVRRRTQQA